MIIKRFNGNEWIFYKAGLLSIEEKCFPKELAMNEQEVEVDCCSDDSFVFLAIDDGGVVGAIYATPLYPHDSLWSDGKWNISDYEHIGDKVAYVCSVGVLPEYRCLGIAKKMKQKMNKALKDSGYEYILSHSNAGAMVHLDESFGAKILKEEKNWGGSKETHYLTETKL